MNPPRQLARAFISRHGLTPPVPYTELLRAAAADGIDVVISNQPLHGRGFCLTLSFGPVIVLREEACGSAWVLSHEIAHALCVDPEEPPGRVSGYADAEAGAEEFARCVAGYGLDPNEDPSRLLRRV
jgi:hypothetical protein